MQKRDWREFFINSVKSLKTVAITSLLVPIFFVMMNTNYHEIGYFNNLVFSTRIGIQISLFSWFGFVISYIFIYIYRPDYLLKIKQSVLANILMGMSFMLIGLGLTHFLEPFLSGRDFGIQSLSVGLLVGGSTFLLCMFYGAYKKTEEINLKLRMESAEASLHVLNNQMQPHFLFNSLNSLVELIESHNDYAAEMTQKLADLYREILMNSKGQLASLESELAIIKKYLELEKMRYEERLSFSITVPSEIENIYLPSLILQTLIENAIKHGISNSLAGGAINILIEKSNSLGYKAVIVSTGSTNKAKVNSGTGLANTRARLELLYGDRHNFNIENSEQQTKVSFWFSGESFGN
jgi:hypothetical protein